MKTDLIKKPSSITFVKHNNFIKGLNMKFHFSKNGCDVNIKKGVR